VTRLRDPRAEGSLARLAGELDAGAVEVKIVPPTSGLYRTLP
jgi:hypothetical protein